MSLSRLFTERLFRIPDYQRGYAWGSKQVADFWVDLQQLSEGKHHYTGVLTLEPVPEEIWRAWEDDEWIIRSRGFRPLYVVDGQQRLTTAIILIKAILDSACADTLNFEPLGDIEKRYLINSKGAGLAKTYIFGYERDNPSYEHLKTNIFGQYSSKSEPPLPETSYTRNLDNAKAFFNERLKGLPDGELELLYRKVTQGIRFNTFEIETDIEVCVAFETMNNRGKLLSTLELLKNRLIYLSIKLDCDPDESKALRRQVNDCWKSIYHNLGRIKDLPISDDDFLRSHSILEFGPSVVKETDSNDPDEEGLDKSKKRIQRIRRVDWESYLLRVHFTNLNLQGPIELDDEVLDSLTKQDPYDLFPSFTATIKPSEITLDGLKSYVVSLQKSVQIWFDLHGVDVDSHPKNSSTKHLQALKRRWMLISRRIMRTPSIYMLVLAFYRKVQSSRQRAAFLVEADRAQFLTFLSGQVFPGRSNDEFLALAIRLEADEISPEQVIENLRDWDKSQTKLRGEFLDKLKNGFYNWYGIRVLLFEYEEHLARESKSHNEKLLWSNFSDLRRIKGMSSVEHIYPQRPQHKYWKERFSTTAFTPTQRKALRNSLGNLLPLSQPKNSSLSNKPFDEKVGNATTKPIGYRFGGYSECEVAIEEEWTPKAILLRGLRMLDFIETRWSLNLGTRKDKKKILGLEWMDG